MDLHFFSLLLLMLMQLSSIFCPHGNITKPQTRDPIEACRRDSSYAETQLHFGDLVLDEYKILIISAHPEYAPPNESLDLVTFPIHTETLFS